MNAYEPGQDRNVAALNICLHVRWFIFMKKDDNYYMSLALKEARKAALIDEVPIGCVIVKDDKVISRSHNMRETKNDPCGHAEIIAIRKASKKLGDWQLINCKIYVTLEPCIMCAGAIIQSRIAGIYYGAKDFKGGALGSSINVLEAENINHKPQVVSGLLESECSQIIKEFFKTYKHLQGINVKVGEIHNFDDTVKLIEEAKMRANNN